jgi:16S rRNA (guanine1516-N2)-methyltransferase
MDCTAGLGEDSILLAAAGFKVKLYERDNIIAALLRDSLIRAAEIPELAPIVERMELHEEDSLIALTKLTQVPEVIYLDPMFPSRQKSALVKKKFQMLQQLEQPCEEGDEFLQAAIACKPKKIVIKRPLKGEYLGNHKPDYSITGKTIRYDCIVLPK